MPSVSDRVTILSHSRRHYDAGGRIRLREQIVDGLDETSPGDLAGEVRCSTKSEHKVQPSLFTRLSVFEAELRATATGGVVAVVEPGRCSARRCHSELLRSARRRAEQAVRDESESG